MSSLVKEMINGPRTTVLPNLLHVKAPEIQGTQTHNATHSSSSAINGIKAYQLTSIGQWPVVFSFPSFQVESSFLFVFFFWLFIYIFICKNECAVALS